ncbi:VWA domain-containing protein [Vibrio astriarenae]
MAEFHFIRPWFLLLFIPLALLLMVIKQTQKEQKKLPIADHLLPYLHTGAHQKRWFAPRQVLPFCLALMIVIIAGPTWQPEPDSHAKNQSPLIFVMDLSRSMGESDIAPSRLENSKLKIAELLEVKTDGLIGAHVYAGSAHMLIPPTEDREVLELYLSALSTNLVPRQGKNLEAVLTQLAEQYSENTIPASIVVVTDSLDNSAIQALDHFNDQYNHQLLIWKFGYNETMSPPSGIRMLQNTADNSDVTTIMRWINSFSYFDPFDEDIEWQEAGFYLVIPTLLLSLLWFRRGWSIQWVPSVLIAVVTMSGFHSPAAYANTQSSNNTCDSMLMRWFLTPDQQGQWYYRQGNYACAAQSFTDPEWKIEALMRNQQWEWALTMLNNQPDSIEKRFNVALSYLHIDRFRSSERWFKQVLELDPTHPQAIANLALLDEIFQLMAERAQGQGTAGEDMTADVISTLEEDMGIEEPEDKIEVINSADLMAEEHLTKIWLEQVKSSPEVFLRNKFAIQLQQSIEPSLPPASSKQETP